MQTANIINMTTTNYQLIVTEDISLNGRLFVSGNVGIGTGTPSCALDVSGTMKITYPNSARLDPTLEIIGSTYSYVRLKKTTNNPNYFFTIGPDNNTNFIVFDDQERGVYLSRGLTAWTSYSDVRLKKNINSLNSYLNKMNQIRPVWYQWETQDENDKHMHVGFIAQEIEQFIPEIINENYDEKRGYNVKGLAMTDMIPFIVKAFQEQQAIIETLQTENQDLKSQLANISERLTVLENK